MKSLVCNYKDKEDDFISIENQADYDILLKSMIKEGMKTVKITFTRNEGRCETGTTSEFELLPSQEKTMQTIHKPYIQPCISLISRALRNV